MGGQARAHLGVPLASVAPSVWHADPARGPARARRGEPDTVPEAVALRRAAQQAVALAQQEKSTWTRADLVKYLGRVLPRTGRDPAQAAALLEDLADRALRSEFEPVCAWSAELAQVPRSLLRADGRSVYRRHGGVRYATRAQLTHGRADGRAGIRAGRAAHDPRGRRAGARRRSGAARAGARGPCECRASAQPTGTGLREDQAAAALAALTDGRRVSVINAPAGSGKTRVFAEIRRVWEAAGLGPVIGITVSQSARNTLAAGVPVSYNSARFLGHLPGQRAPAARCRSPRARFFRSTRHR